MLIPLYEAKSFAKKQHWSICLILSNLTILTFFAIDGFSSQERNKSQNPWKSCENLLTLHTGKPLKSGADFARVPSIGKQRNICELFSEG